MSFKLVKFVKVDVDVGVGVSEKFKNKKNCNAATCLSRTVLIQMFGLPAVAGCPNLHLAASKIPRGTSYLKKIKFNL